MPPQERGPRRPATAHQLRDGLPKPSLPAAGRLDRVAPALAHGRARIARTTHRLASSSARAHARGASRLPHPCLRLAGCELPLFEPAVIEACSRPPAASLAKSTASLTTRSPPPRWQKRKPSIPSSSRPRSMKSAPESPPQNTMNHELMPIPEDYSTAQRLAILELLEICTTPSAMPMRFSCMNLPVPNWPNSPKRKIASISIPTSSSDPLTSHIAPSSTALPPGRAMREIVFKSARNGCVGDAVDGIKRRFCPSCGSSCLRW